MATASGNVDLGQLTGHFDESVIVAYNICNISRYILNSFENTFNFCCQVKLLNKERQCDYCRRHLNLCLDRRDGHATPVVYRCTNRGCRKCSQYVSIRKGSVFESSNLSLQQILLIINLFTSHITSYEQIRLQTQLTETKLSDETIADWLSYCREICLETIARQTPTVIGGQGMTVEIDESKFGKRKYNKGRLVEGQW